MSVVAIPSRRHPGVRPARPRTGPTLTITLDLTPGPLSPRLARLVQLLGELAESGEGELRAVEDAAPGPRPAPRPPPPSRPPTRTTSASWPARGWSAGATASSR